MMNTELKRENMNDIENITCVICLEEVKQSKQYTKIEILKGIEDENLCNCLEKIHDNCLESWLKINMSCPLCRKEFDTKKELISYGLNPIESPIWETYYIDEQELIEYYNDRRERLKIVNYLLRLACVIIITTLTFSGYNVIQKISNLF